MNACVRLLPLIFPVFWSSLLCLWFCKIQNVDSSNEIWTKNELYRQSLVEVWSKQRHTSHKTHRRIFQTKRTHRVEFRFDCFPGVLTSARNQPLAAVAAREIVVVCCTKRHICASRFSDFEDFSLPVCFARPAKTSIVSQSCLFVAC